MFTAKIKNDKVHEGNAVLSKMLNYDLVPCVATYTILIDGLCQAGEITRAFNMLELMKQDGCTPNVYTYTVISTCLCQN